MYTQHIHNESECHCTKSMNGDNLPVIFNCILLVALQLWAVSCMCVHNIKLLLRGCLLIYLNVYLWIYCFTDCQWSQRKDLIWFYGLALYCWSLVWQKKSFMTAIKVIMLICRFKKLGALFSDGSMTQGDFPERNKSSRVNNLFTTRHNPHTEE